MDLLRKPTVWVAIIAVCLSLLLLGHRGTWDPDEGRYTNVGLNMLDSGDWLNPRRNEEVGHWTKPPMTYWAIASSVAVFGVNTWAARLPAALSYLLCVWLVWRMARRLSPGSEATAALAYATMLLTIGASQYITTDFILDRVLDVRDARLRRSALRRFATAVVDRDDLDRVRAGVPDEGAADVVAAARAGRVRLVDARQATPARVRLVGAVVSGARAAVVPRGRAPASGVARILPRQPR